MGGIVQYGKTVKVFFGKTGAEIPGKCGNKFKLVYYITKNDAKVDELKSATYGIQIIQLDSLGYGVEEATIIDICTELSKLETLAKRLVDVKALPEALHNIVTYFIEEINSVDF